MRVCENRYSLHDERNSEHEMNYTEPWLIQQNEILDFRNSINLHTEHIEQK